MKKYTDTQILNNIFAELDIEHWWTEMTCGHTDEYKFNGMNDRKIQENMPRTEISAAEFIARKFQNHLTFIPTQTAKGTWYVWDGQIHRPLGSGDDFVLKIIMKFQRQLVEALRVVRDTYEAKALKSGDDDSAAKIRKIYDGEWRKFRSFRDYIAGDRNQKAVLTQMKRILDKDDDHFLDDREWIVLENGVYSVPNIIETRQFELLPHSAERPVFRMWHLTDAPGTQYPELSAFLRDSIEDEGQARFFSKAVALSFFGAPTSTKTLVSLQGATNSGKSMINRVIKKLSEGSDFYSAPPRDAIVANAKKPEHARYKMRRARYVAFSEIRSDLDSEFVLNYTGGDDYGIEEKFIESTSVAPQGIIFMASNEGVKVDKTDAAMYTRIAPIKFPHTFEIGIDENVNLEKEIIANGSGFLEWLKWSFLTYLEEGLDKTDRMEEIKAGEREEDSTAFQYIDYLIEEGQLYFDPAVRKSHSIKLSDAHRNYVEYCREHSIKKPLAQATFRKHLETRYEVSNTAGWRVVGLSWISEYARKF